MVAMVTSASGWGRAAGREPHRVDPFSLREVSPLMAMTHGASDSAATGSAAMDSGSTDPVASDLSIRVIGRLPLSLSDEERAEFLRRTAELAELTRRHDGVVFYSCNADIEVVGTYVFDEVWPSFEVFQAHLQTTHFNGWWAWVEPRLSGSLQIDYAALSSLQRLP